MDSSSSTSSSSSPAATRFAHLHHLHQRQKSVMLTASDPASTAPQRHGTASNTRAYPAAGNCRGRSPSPVAKKRAKILSPARASERLGDNNCRSSGMMLAADDGGDVDTKVEVVEDYERALAKISATSPSDGRFRDAHGEETKPSVLDLSPKSLKSQVHHDRKIG